MSRQRSAIFVTTTAALLAALPLLGACRPVAAPGETPVANAATPTLPPYLAALQAAYGPPSDAGFGSAVFYTALADDASLEQAALDKYKAFTGELWQRYGEAAWMGPWKEVYARAPGVPAGIVQNCAGSPIGMRPSRCR